MKGWLREPLLHFLAIGAVLWAASSLMDRGPRAPRDDEVVLTGAQVEQLATIFVKTRDRLPTRAELEALVEDRIRGELALREAIEMGLDRGDAVVRRRLRQKLEFFAEGLSDQVEPTEEELREYLDAHPGDFRQEPVLDFRHVFLSPDLRGEALEADAAALLERLAGEDDPDLQALGDVLILDRSFAALPLREARALFGLRFANGLEALEPGRWSGPIPSGYGAHLVIVDRRVEGRIPALEEVRAAVEREWRSARRERALQTFYAALRERYNVRVEWPAAEAPPDGAARDDAGEESP